MTFRQQMRSAGAVLVVTPEYNRSIPGGLKNALDVGSRPFGQSVWDGKPGAIASISRGAMGAFGANHHLRQALVFLNVPTMPQPEVYIGGVPSLEAPLQSGHAHGSGRRPTRNTVSAGQTGVR